MAQNITFRINKKKLRRLKELLTPDLAKIIDEEMFDLAGKAEEKRTKNIKKRVYGQSPSSRYRRTGRALGAAKVVKLGAGKYKLDDNTMNKGAGKNYSPMLNRNRRIRKLNTLYFTDMKKEMRAEKRKVAKRIIKKAFRNKTK